MAAHSPRESSGVTETQASLYNAESNPRDRVWDEIEKGSLIALAGKERHMRFLP